MWIGFFIIAFGIVSYIVPTSFINDKLLDGNFQIITIGSGVITEVISALFLWIYKNSIDRLTYFYNRQMFIHNSLLAYKIANTMNDSDKAKEIIVGKILEFGISSNKQSVLKSKKAPPPEES